MKPGDLVTCRGGPYGETSDFCGIIVGYNKYSAKGDNKIKYFDVLGLDGELKVYNERTLKVFRESR